MALTAIDFDKLVIDKIMGVTGINRTTSEIKFMFDEIKEGTLENGGETVYGTGSGDRRISALSKAKTSKVTFKNGYVVASAYATQIGADIVDASVGTPLVVPTVETLSVTIGTDATVTLPNTPITTSVKYAYKANKDMTQGKKYEVSATAGADKFTLTGSTLAFPVADFVAGDAIIISYEYSATVGRAIKNNSEKYAENVKLIIDVLMRDVCDNATVYHTKIVYFNTIPDMNTTISVGGEPAVHDFSAESLVDPCSIDKNYWTWFIVE